MSQKVAVDCGHGYVKALSATGQRTLFPSLIAPAVPGLDMGPLSAARLTPVQWADQSPIAYWVGEDAQLQAASLFGADKAADTLTRDLTVIAVERLANNGNGLSDHQVVHLAVGVPLSWYGRQRQTLSRALQGAVRVYDTALWIDQVEVFPQGVAAILAALPANPLQGLYGLADVGYRTTDYLIVQVGSEGLPTVVSGFAGSFELGIHHALQEVASAIEQQWGAAYAPHELADARTVTVRGQEIAVGADIRTAYARLGQSLAAKLQTVWAPVLPRLRALYLAGGGVIAMPPTVGEMPVRIVPDAQWANAQGYLAAMGPDAR